MSTEQLQLMDGDNSYHVSKSRGAKTVVLYVAPTGEAIALDDEDRTPSREHIMDVLLADAPSQDQVTMRRLRGDLTNGSFFKRNSNRGRTGQGRSNTSTVGRCQSSVRLLTQLIP